MVKLNIGGVPEHFNLPWHLCIEEGAFKDAEINLQWNEYAGGTGAMCKGLRDGDIDIAIILSEGIVKDIIAGNPSKIIQTYIETPLVWGIHVGANATPTTITDLKGEKAAISRFGSGSHLMAYVHAQQQGWNTSELDFDVIQNLNGAIDSLSKTNNYFLWEHFTTKPLVDNGTFRRIGDIPTPWPCFVIAVREEILNTEPEAIKQVLQVINNKTRSFKNTPEIDQLLAERYQQQLADIKKWLSITEWSQQQINIETLDKIQSQLFDLDIINKKVNSSILQW